MLADAHRKAAEDIESTILPLQAQPRAARVVIEGAWGAAFQWIAFGCETKYQQHLNNHTRLGRFLRSLGEKTAADWWEALDLTPGKLAGMGASRILPTLTRHCLCWSRFVCGPHNERRKNNATRLSSYTSLVRRRDELACQRYS